MTGIDRGRAVAHEGPRMDRISDDAQFAAIREAGWGLVYNDFSGRGPSGAQYNVVHAASCPWLARSNLAVPKLWFADLASAAEWLRANRGEEDRAWRRCGTCRGNARSVSSPVRAGEPARGPRTTTSDASPAFAVVTDPARSRVEAWSTARLPFEPTGAMREFRAELRDAVGRLTAVSSQALHARYTSPEAGRFDVENVLLYNVGPSAFRDAARFELVVEREHGPIPEPPAGLQARHHYRYEVVPSGSYPQWSGARALASFGPVEIGPSAQGLRPSGFWYAVRRGDIEVGPAPDSPSAFGLELDIEVADLAGLNLAEIAKPLIDAVVAVFHSHDDPASLDLVASRVAEQLGVSVDEVRSLLVSDRFAILGARRLLWAWRSGVQWNPADDLCAAFRIRRVAGAIAPSASRALRIRGRLMAIEPS